MSYKKSDSDVTTDIVSAAISMDIDAVDALIQSQGVEMVHYSAMPCPVGKTSPYEENATHADHHTCSNGYVFRKTGVVMTLMTSNSKNERNDITGQLVDSGSYTTFSRQYLDSDKDVFVTAYDRFYIDEERILTVAYEEIIHNERGIDRVKFPISSVLDLMDANGITFKQGTDFCIKDGNIVWNDGIRPGTTLDVQIGGPDRGVVLAVRYLYRPFWYCASINHDMRVTQVFDNDGNRSIIKMPQAAMLKREVLHRNEYFNSEGNFTNRKADEPRDGGFGSI